MGTGTIFSVDEARRFDYPIVHRLSPLTYFSLNLPLVRQIEALVDKILSAKKQNPQSDTTALEREIDMLVYRLYNLTDEEISIIENYEK